MTRLYLITQPTFDLQVMSLTSAVLDAADVACLQLRLKGASDAQWKEAIHALMPVCTAREVALLLNDRVDLAKEMNCDGVHVGQDDMPYDEARKRLGPDKIIGVSAYASKDRAMELASAGADYVAFGSAFPSSTKEEAPPVALSVLEDWAAMAITPCVAIGGITAENCAPLVRAGVDFLAVIGAVWNHPEGPVAGIKKLQAAIVEAAAALPHPGASRDPV